MKRSLLDILACPRCTNPLGVEPEDDEIMDGELACSNCQARYSIQAGIPVMMLMDDNWGETSTEVEGEQEFVHELPVSEHIKRNHFETERSRRLLEQVEIGPNPRVLDVGGSSGLGAYLFRDYSPEVVVTDIVPFFVQLAEVCLGKTMPVHGVPCGVEWLPFQDGSFDVVFCRQALHHSLEPIEAIREMFRVTKSGGTVLVASEPCLSSYDVWLKTRNDAKRGAKKTEDLGVMSKLPDELFAHTWPEFKNWFSGFSDDFKILPAGGSAATVCTDRGLVFEPHYRQRQWKGKLLQSLLPGMRGYRGDLNVIARKTREIKRPTDRPLPNPIPPNGWSIPPLSEETIRDQREMFPKMFPFPVEI